jgi:hypothetical protein
MRALQEAFFSSLLASLVWRLRSSFKKSKRWQPLKLNSNPPLSPFFKGGIFSVRFSPLFAKEGKGRFFDGMTRELCRELLRQDTSLEVFPTARTVDLHQPEPEHDVALRRGERK